MEWLFQSFERIAQSFIWKSFLSQFEWIDWVAALFLLIGLIYGIQNGLMGEIAEILELIVMIFVVHRYYEKVSLFLTENIKQLPDASVPAMSFILVTAAVWIVMRFVMRRVRKLVHSQMSVVLRSLGGALFGCVHLFLLLSFLCQALVLLPYKPIKRVFEEGNSFTGYYLGKLSPRVHDVIASPMAIFQPQSSDKSASG